jgi:addiction module RelB/DinJ family antitoxin
MKTKGVGLVSIQVSTRIDATTKQQFDNICDIIGISPSNALSMFIKSVINYKGIPFAAIAPPEKMPVIPREAVFGCLREQFTMADDFNAPLDDFKEYM